MQPCDHYLQRKNAAPRTVGCEECLKSGDTWVHLRVCLECGHVGCCNSSKNKHATKHFHETGHAMIRSLELGEEWGYCYVHDLFYEKL
ncbi:MAG: UBP-type zinc finger domain-containing protein [Anaerolineae bacterium]|nr:UBP-type zinc finger domain-containing protein [Anaerolineae bacterium]NUQ02783.1 UBP-type zinc finger domain-containing protein [Anaerolineae bacterium]